MADKTLGKVHPVNVAGLNPNPLPLPADECDEPEILAEADFPSPLPDHLL